MLRKPDSIPASDTVISDPALEPFFITRSQTGGFTLYERVTKGEALHDQDEELRSLVEERKNLPSADSQKRAELSKRIKRRIGRKKKKIQKTTGC